MYRYVHGDQDLFRLGFAISGQHHSYYQVCKTKQLAVVGQHL